MKRHMSGFLYLALSTACGRSRAAGEAGGAQIVVYILHLVVACTVRGPQAIVRDERIGHHVIAHEFLFTPTDRSLEIVVRIRREQRRVGSALIAINNLVDIRFVIEVVGFDHCGMAGAATACNDMKVKILVNLQGH